MPLGPLGGVKESLTPRPSPEGNLSHLSGEGGPSPERDCTNTIWRQAVTAPECAQVSASWACAWCQVLSSAQRVGGQTPRPCFPITEGVMSPSVVTLRQWGVAAGGPGPWRRRLPSSPRSSSKELISPGPCQVRGGWERHCRCQAHQEWRQGGVQVPVMFGEWWGCVWVWESQEATGTP